METMGVAVGSVTGADGAVVVGASIGVGATGGVIGTDEVGAELATGRGIGATAIGAGELPQAVSNNQGAARRMAGT